MAPLDFPSSPTNGQYYGGYVYNAANETWDSAYAPRAATVPISSPNYIINGAFDIWQRGTSANGDSPKYLADRWHIQRDSNAAGATYSRQAGVDNTLQYCIRVQRDSGSSTSFPLYLRQALETLDSVKMAGKTVTLSFYARKGANFSAASDALSVRLYTGTGVDQAVLSIASWTGVATPINSTATLTSSWTRYSFTGAVSSTATQVGIMFTHNVTGTAGTSDFFEVAGVQLEDGAAATDFRRNAPSIQGELAACQRYYYRVSGASTTTLGSYFNATQFYAFIFFPVSMRVPPVSWEFSATNTYNVYVNGVARKVTSMVMSDRTTNVMELACVTSAAAGGNAGHMGGDVANSFIAISAEL